MHPQGTARMVNHHQPRSTISHGPASLASLPTETAWNALVILPSPQQVAASDCMEEPGKFLEAKLVTMALNHGEEFV